MRRNTIKSVISAAILIAAFASKTNGQSIAIDFIQFEARTVVVHYTLDDGSNSNRQFLVQLYSSQDNFTTPLTRVTGDVGSEVSAGVDKKIVWDLTKELGDYKGTLSLEVRGRVYVPFVKLTMPEDQVFKRGKNYPLTWTSGNLSGQVNIELFNEAGERIWGENNVPNIGKFDWYLGTHVGKGGGYRLKFTNAKDRNDVVYSKPFSVKPKIPLLLKIGGLAIVGGVVGYLITRPKETSGSEDKSYGEPPIPNTN
jgi:hypothetical protein